MTVCEIDQGAVTPKTEPGLEPRRADWLTGRSFAACKLYVSALSLFSLDLRTRML
jgi:hypothetical protein